ncbi:Alkaline phosphatase L [Acinetobacter oleivorans]|nr:Alkaline phosphatase L [Acinetobacter oleivorans]CAI3099713.1 Alkaline phosphatase L [Acinetobacter oleivorans]CAI3099717.1 Alkaline phosphatase L [Acinetobacter oleivorans]CAI3099745.1 Alkaline phosphatase L [Acinetobacter oleivorans]CAI3118800.1 Alkaline phosphatase L [Acinetobacter oleivorans]
MDGSINILKVISFGVIVAMSGAATAATYNAQGASFPEKAYTGNTNSIFPATSPAPTATSLFGQYKTASGHSVTYAGNGSGAGKTAIQNNTSPFAGSDSPLTQANYTSIISGAGGTAHIAPIQVPAIIGSIAVVFNNPILPTNTNLTSIQIAKIFAGEITNWNQVNTSLPSLPIKVITHGAASGTTFGFVNHLNTVSHVDLPNNSSGLNNNRFFKVDELFSNSLNGGAPFPAITYYPQSNDQAVVNYVNANVGAIGYTSTANALTTSGTKIASVNGYTPNTPSTTFLTSASILTDRVINGNNSTTGAANVVALTGIPAGKAGKIKLINPAAYANPTGVYPILAVSYLLSYTDNNGTTAVVSGLKGALKAPYDANYQAGLGAGSQGFGFIPAIHVPQFNAVINSIN